MPLGLELSGFIEVGARSQELFPSASFPLVLSLSRGTPRWTVSLLKPDSALFCSWALSNEDDALDNHLVLSALSAAERNTVKRSGSVLGD